jgi:chromosome segregation ATPase
MADNAESKGCFRTLLDFILVLATVVLAWVAWNEWRDKRDVLVEVENLRHDLESIQAQLKQSQETVREQRKELEKSLETFANHYREKVDSVARALAVYQSFDTPENRKEYGKDFEKRKAERFEEFRGKLEALIVFVKNWRGVLEALRRTLNGRFDALEMDVVKGDEKKMLTGFTIIRENIESEIDRLKKTLDAAVKTQRN